MTGVFFPLRTTFPKPVFGFLVLSRIAPYPVLGLAIVVMGFFGFLGTVGAAIGAAGALSVISALYRKGISPFMI